MARRTSISDLLKSSRLERVYAWVPRRDLLARTFSDPEGLTVVSMALIAALWGAPDKSSLLAGVIVGTGAFLMDVFAAGSPQRLRSPDKPRVGPFGFFQVTGDLESLSFIIRLAAIALMARLFPIMLFSCGVAALLASRQALSINEKNPPLGSFWPRVGPHSETGERGEWSLRRGLLGRNYFARYQDVTFAVAAALLSVYVFFPEVAFRRLIGVTLFVIILSVPVARLFIPSRKSP